MSKLFFWNLFLKSLSARLQAVGSMCYCVLIRVPSLQLFSEKGCVGAWLVTVPDKPVYCFL